MHWHQADPRAVAAAVAGAPGARRRRRLPRPVLARRKTAEKCLAALHETFPVRQCSGRLAASPSRCAVRARRDGPLPVAVRRQRRRRRRTPRWCAELRDSLLRRPDEVVDGDQRADGRARRRRAVRGGRRRTATGWRRSCGPRPAPSGSRALTRCPEVVAARREDDGRWAVHVVRHGRLAAAGVIPPGADADQYVAELRASAETVRPGPGPDAGRDRRGDREDPALAGVRRASGWSRSTASGPARSRGATRHLARPRRGRRSRGARWCRSTSGAIAAPRRCTSRCPLACAHDHRHRLRQGRRRPHPRGGRGDRRARRASARSTP